MKRLLILSLAKSMLAFMLLFTGCAKSDPINSDILVDVEVAEGRFEIHAETERVEPCRNYEIDHAVRSSGKTITIRFLQIDENEPCFTQSWPATAVVDLGALDKSEYTIKFKLDGQTTKATLSTESPAELVMNEEGNVRLKD